ncbi:MAG: tetratricopeptide repeat protein [Pseudomonadota bacterium]
MATYASDDEQLDALKSWWRDNGTALLTGIVIVLALFFGVQQWQRSSEANSGAASDLYQQIADMALAKMSVAVTEDDLLAVQNVYGQLKSEYESSIYTRYAALIMARFQAELNHLDAAETELQWIIDNPKLGVLKTADEELFLISRLRLAKIKLAKGEAQAAIDLLKAEDAGSFVAVYAELEGDALLSQGDREGAKAAYERALAAITTGNPVLLKLKLQDLGVSPVEQL